MSGALEVVACPMPISIQDLGRPGYRHLGVPLSGALDGLSLQLLNALAGNAVDAAVLEMRLVGPTLRAGTAVRVALAHATGSIERGGESKEMESLPPWQTATLQAGDCLRIGQVSGGAAYLAVSGGFAVPMVLGSRSFYARAGIGASLGVGTKLPVTAQAPEGDERAVLPAPTFDNEDPLRVMPGPQAGHFTAAAFATLYGNSYRVGRAADRMGLRLEGPLLQHDPLRGADIASDAVTPGAIQVPGDGQPIVLLADGQTVGGYAKIATVISADLPRLGRLLPGDELRFAPVDAAAARAVRQATDAWLAAQIAAIRALPPAGGVDLLALYSQNLVDGVIHAH
ncbi:MAG: biotin-dependent carboxyltransferase family protein [Rhodocyclaceae bacterium]|nr:biotin-dependent carboxyltransferase family protein [Rhodocyclaceae bacterium]